MIWQSMSSLKGFFSVPFGDYERSDTYLTFYSAIKQSFLKIAILCACVNRH